MVTASGGVLDADTMAAAPIHSINSGPAMAPVAGRHYADARGGRRPPRSIADTGGTSLRRRASCATVGSRGRASRGSAGSTRATSPGSRRSTSSSIGAGGGSIAWVDDGGLLRVGPGSAGADPGPACYGARRRAPDGHRRRGRARVPRSRLLPRWRDRARRAGRAASASSSDIGEPAGLTAEAAAIAVLRLATEQMVRAIEDITRRPQGIDPRDAVLVAGGGAAGFNAVAIARRLGCKRVVFPDLGAALSAVGGAASPTSSPSTARRSARAATRSTSRRRAPRSSELDARCRRFAARSGRERGGDADRVRSPRRATPARCGSSRFRCRGARFESRSGRRGAGRATSTITTGGVRGLRPQVADRGDRLARPGPAASSTRAPRSLRHRARPRPPALTRPARRGSPGIRIRSGRPCDRCRDRPRARSSPARRSSSSPVTTIVLEPGARAVGTERRQPRGRDRCRDRAGGSHARPGGGRVTRAARRLDPRRAGGDLEPVRGGIVLADVNTLLRTRARA